MVGATVTTVIVTAAYPRQVSLGWQTEAHRFNAAVARDRRRAVDALIYVGSDLSDLRGWETACASGTVGDMTTATFNPSSLPSGATGFTHDGCAVPWLHSGHRCPGGWTGGAPGESSLPTRREHDHGQRRRISMRRWHSRRAGAAATDVVGAGQAAATLEALPRRSPSTTDEHEPERVATEVPYAYLANGAPACRYRRSPRSRRLGAEVLAQPTSLVAGIRLP